VWSSHRRHKPPRRAEARCGVDVIRLAFGESLLKFG
jgi:hypothetical protein